MPFSPAAYDRARECLTVIPDEDAVVLRPLAPYRVMRELFTVLLRHGGLSRETRRHLVQAFQAGTDPTLERKIIAAVSERWEGDLARGLSAALADCVEAIEHDDDPELDPAVA